MSDDVFKDILEAIKKGNERLDKIQVTLKDSVTNASTPIEDAENKKSSRTQLSKSLQQLVDITKKQASKDPALEALGNLAKVFGRGGKQIIKAGSDGANLFQGIGASSPKVDAKVKGIPTMAASHAAANTAAKKTVEALNKKFGKGGEAAAKTMAGAGTRSSIPGNVSKAGAAKAAVEATEGLGGLAGGLGEATAGIARFATGLIAVNPVLAAVVAGITVAVGAFVALAVAVVSITQKFIESQRYLSKYNGVLAAAYAQAKVRQIMRDIKVARETAAGTAKLIAAFEDLKDAFAPIKIALINLATAILTPLVQALTKVIQVVAKFAVPIIHVMTTVANVVGLVIKIVTTVIMQALRPMMALADAIYKILKPLLDAINRGVAVFERWFPESDEDKKKREAKEKAEKAGHSNFAGASMFQQFAQGRTPRQNSHWDGRGRLGSRGALPPSK